MTLRISREKDNYTLIYDGIDLTQLFYENKMAGYEPQVRFTGLHRIRTIFQTLH